MAQISSLNVDELTNLKERMIPYLKHAHAEHKIDMLFFMLTNILTESTELLCEGNGSESLIRSAFHLDTEDEVTLAENEILLPGVVSRKKQLIPAIMIACEE